MKTHKIIILVGACVLGALASVVAQPSPNTKEDQSAAKAAAPTAEDRKPAPAKEAAALSKGEAASASKEAAAEQGGAAPSGEPTAEANSSEADKTPVAPAHIVAEGEKGLRLNFRGARLEHVLHYLSEAAGFIIIPKVDVQGKVDVWSDQPLTKDEAVQVLNQVLKDNGYAVQRKENTLTVDRKERLMKSDLPVHVGSDPAGIPKNEEIVTQIIPVRFINAPQVAKDLLPLLPETAEMTSNADGNALVVTDTQTTIRRFSEIVKALDTAVSSLSSVKVFALKFADAKSLAQVVKDLFANTQDSGGGRGGMDPRSRLFSFMRGGMGGPGGMPGANGQSSGGRPGASRVVATSDDRSNSLVVSAPADVMPTIVELVESVDTDVEETLELRVFHLKNADPQEMAQLLTSLFPDPTLANRGGNSGGSRFGRFTGGGRGGPGGPGGGGGGGGSSASDRALKEQRVLAIPDNRTGSVVVSAAHQVMLEVQKTVEELDADPAKQQKVFIYELKNGDVQNTEAIVRNLFPSSNSRNTSSSQNRSALETREIQTMQYQTPTTGFGTTPGSRPGGSTFR